ncbi:MAG: ABC-type transport auxiliary lipoprotein family protein, partial [Rhizomicrobium sp.]
MMPPLHRRHVLSSGTALLLSACTNLIGPQPASQIYLLRPPLPQSATGSGAGGKVDWALAVARPDASDALDGDRIALTRTPTELDYYANAQWADRLPRLVQAALIAGFEASGRIAAVAREEDAVHADYELLTDIRDFEARYRSLDAAPDAAVTLISQIADSRSRAIVAGLN